MALEGYAGSKEGSTKTRHRGRGPTPVGFRLIKRAQETFDTRDEGVLTVAKRSISLSLYSVCTRHTPVTTFGPGDWGIWWFPTADEVLDFLRVQSGRTLLGKVSPVRRNWSGPRFMNDSGPTGHRRVTGPIFVRDPVSEHVTLSTCDHPFW